MENLRSIQVDGIWYKWTIEEDVYSTEILVLKPNSSEILCNITLDCSSEHAYVEPSPHPPIGLELDYFEASRMSTGDLIRWAVSMFN